MEITVVALVGPVRPKWQWLLGDVLRLSTVNTPKQKRVEEREREMKLGDCSRAKTGLPPDPSKAQSG